MSLLSLTGVLTSLRRLFAKIRVNEGNGDVTTTTPRQTTFSGASPAIGVEQTTAAAQPVEVL